MDKIVIRGGNKLSGEVRVSSAKNSVLPIIAASILSSDKCVIEHAPLLEDVYVISDVLSSVNARVDIDSRKNKIVIDTSCISHNEPAGDLVRKMRASF